jgi:DNA-binding response OmpR family regulator
MFRVLIVDDDPNICLFFETLLEKMDCETYTAKRVDDAKALSLQNAYDLILLDLELPDGNGLDIMPDLERRIAPGGVAILSGIIRERKSDVLAALEKSNLHILDETREEEWVALAVKH